MVIGPAWAEPEAKKGKLAIAKSKLTLHAKMRRFNFRSIMSRF
jgi:hypothetical protein